MKRYLLFISLALVAFVAMAQMPAQLKNEVLNYKVMYKWGLINKQAGTAKLSITNDGDYYRTKLTARSDPWADKFYTLRDTLAGTVLKAGFKPQRYEIFAHEDGDYKHDKVTYKYGKNSVSANCVRVKRKAKAQKPTTRTTTVESNGLALDMLSMFYYMRYLDFPNMKVGQETKLHIFSGTKKELLTIKYLGKEELKFDGKKHSTYRITFTFTTDSGKQTSDGMDAWISDTSQRIPLKLEGKLKVGKVHCLYTGQN